MRDWQEALQGDVWSECLWDYFWFLLLDEKSIEDPYNMQKHMKKKTKLSYKDRA